MDDEDLTFAKITVEQRRWVGTMRVQREVIAKDTGDMFNRLIRTQFSLLIDLRNKWASIASTLAGKTAGLNNTTNCCPGQRHFSLGWSMNIAGLADSLWASLGPVSINIGGVDNEVAVSEAHAQSQSLDFPPKAPERIRPSNTHGGD